MEHAMSREIMCGKVQEIGALEHRVLISYQPYVRSMYDHAILIYIHTYLFSGIEEHLSACRYFSRDWITYGTATPGYPIAMNKHLLILVEIGIFYEALSANCASRKHQKSGLHPQFLDGKIQLIWYSHLARTPHIDACCIVRAGMTCEYT